MADIKVKDLFVTTSITTDNKLMVLTSEANNTVQNITIEDFNENNISSDNDNVLEKGTDGKLYVATPEEITGELENLNTTDKSALVGAINEVLGDVGNISLLPTTDKTSVVASITELNNKIPEDGGADQSLSNLTSNGNAKLQYAPFSVNNGSVDASGNNATLTHSGATLTCGNCTITTADGRVKSIGTSASYDCASLANGTYKVLRDYETGALSVVSNLTIAKVEPATPSSGDYWLDNSQKPIVLKTYDGANWETDNDKVYLGNVTIESSTITAVFNADFNATKSGQWVYSKSTLNTATTLTSYTVSLNSYLPNDIFDYEVIFNEEYQRAGGSGTGYVQLYFGVDGTNVFKIGTVSTAGAIATGEVTAPVKGRSVYLSMSGNSTLANQTLSAYGYRRIGVI